jgi:hypothetical protein
MRDHVNRFSRHTGYNTGTICVLLSSNIRTLFYGRSVGADFHMVRRGTNRTAALDVCWDLQVSVPDVNAYVFCRVHEDIGSVEINEMGDKVDLRPSDIFIIRYNVIAPFLRAERVSLM